MGYTPSEYVDDCKRDVVRAKLVAQHYPDAHQDKICGRTVWCHEDALSRMTGFEVDVTDKGAERWDRYGVDLVPYHEIQEGDVRARVYVPGGWRGRMASFDFVGRVQKNAALREMVFALFKKETP
jgi:hypothetical protein